MSHKDRALLVLILCFMMLCALLLVNIYKTVADIESAVCEEVEEDDSGSFLAWRYRVCDPTVSPEVHADPQHTHGGEVR